MTTVAIPQTAREYLRVSFDGSGRERSPAEQHSDNERACNVRGWVLGGAYKDIGSASSRARKARADFDRLVADLEQGRFDATILILWEPSRGSRKMSEWLALIELCRDRGVKIFVTADSKLYDPANARDRKGLLEDGIDAEYESEKISGRARRARAADAAAGRPNGPTPYGYRRVYDSATGRLLRQEPHPDEAPVVIELFDRLKAGHTLFAIAKDFRERGITRRQRLDKETGEPLERKPFSDQHLRVLAMTRAYMGEREHAPGRKDRRLKGLQPVYTKATWKPLVSRAKFLAVQRILSDPSRVTVRPGRGKHLLSMIVPCDVCEGPLAAAAGTGAASGWVYRCRDGGHVTVGYAELNEHTEGQMLAYLRRKDNRRAMAAAAAAADDASEALKVVRDELADIQEELDDLAAKVGRKELTQDFAVRAEPGIRARLKAAQAREAELSAPDELGRLIGTDTDIDAFWRDAPMDVKRQITRLLLHPKRLGELRVTHAPVKGVRAPIEERVVWLRDA